MKNRFKILLIAFLFIMGINAIMFSSLLSISSFADGEEDSSSDFFAFEQSIIELNQSNNNVTIDSALYEESCLNEENVIDPKLLKDYCNNNDSYYILTEDGYDVYSNYGLKRLIVQGDLKVNYNAISVYSYNDLHILSYATEAETEYAYNELSKDTTLVVSIDKYENIAGYADGTYDYSIYKNWGPEAADIGGYRKFLSDKNVTKEVVVAVLDTGLNTSHEMFTNRLIKESGKIVGYAYYDSPYKYSYNNLAFASDDTKKYSFEDDGGHGSHVAGIICDMTPSNVKILPIKIGDPNNKNSSNSSIMLSAYLRVLEVYSKKYNIVATNLSYTGGGKSSNSERDNFNSQCYTPMKNKKILPVTAAGNDYNEMNVEGLEAVVVSALRRNSKEYIFEDSYSNYGKLIDISAPGSSIYSAYKNSSNGPGVKSYATLNGTSMASPQVAGMVALLYLNPNLASNFTANDIENTLYDYSIDLGAPGKDIYYGHGMINIRYFEVKESGTISFYKNSTLITEYCDYEPFVDAFNLKIQCSNSNYTIYYTTDKTIPSVTNKNIYTSPILINSTIYLNVMGVKIQNGAIVERTPMYNVSFFDLNTSIESCFVINTAGTITSYTGMFTELHIPTRIKNIEVKSIGSSLFYDDKRLEIVSLPSSCTTIQNYGFYGCQNLKYLYAPGVTKTGCAVFYECDSVKFATDETPASNANEGFYLPSLKDIHSWTFGYSDNLESVKLGKVDTISNEDGKDFYKCLKLKSAELPLLPKIPTMFFYDCTSLESFSFGKNVSSIGSDSFKNVELKNIYCNSSNKTYYADGYGLYNATSLIYFATKHTGDYDIKGTVKINGVSKTITTLESNVLNGVSIGNLTIPSSITQVGAYFARNATIKDLYYNSTNGVSTLYNGSSPFNGAKINKIVIGSNVNKVPEKFFYYANTKTIVINSVNTKLESYSLYCYTSDKNYYYDVYLDFNSITTTFIDYINTSRLYSCTNVLYSKAKITSTSSVIPKYLGVKEVYYVYSNYGYKVTSSVKGSGRIDPLGDIAFFAGDSKTFNIIPEVGWIIKDVKVNNVSVGAVETYTLSNISKDTTIVAEFEEITATYYVITVECGEGGTITPNYDVGVVEGGSKTFTITPNTGYMISVILVDGKSVTVNNTYTFTNVTANHSISVMFEKQKFVINASYGANGLILPSGVANVRYGDNKTYEFIPSLGYHVNSIKVDDVNLIGDEFTNAISNGYTFKDINKNHKIFVDFAINTYTINATSGVNGSISPSGESTYTYGSSKVFIITPSKGYHIDSILVNNQAIADSNFDDIVKNGYKFNSIKENYTIHVNFAINIYTLTATASSGGSISPLGSIDVQYGGSKRFVFTPNEHYLVYSIVVDSNNLTGSEFTNAVNNGYLFTGVEADHTINVVFDLMSYNIVASTTINGVISPSGVTPVKYGEDKTFTFIPSVGYELSGVVVDNVALSALEVENAKVNGYTFENVTKGYTISATFKLKSYKVVSSANDYGSVSPKGESVVEHGSSINYTFTPHDGYKVNKVFINGENIGAFASYKLENISSDCEVYVEFVRIAYDITATVIGNGSITPEGVTSVFEGNSITYVFTPDDKHKIKDVKVNGVSIGKPSSYVFVNVVSDQTIVVEFEEIIFTLSLVCDNNGSINSGEDPIGATSISVVAGEYQRLDFKPNEGYRVKDVKIDDVSVGALEYYIFLSLDASHTISVDYELKKYNINVNIDGEGVIECDDVLMDVSHGDSRVLTVKPNNNWKVYKVYIDGKVADIKDNLIVINAVKADLDIQAVFIEDDAILGIDSTIFVIIVGCLAIFVLLTILIVMLSKNKKRINVVNTDANNKTTYEKEVVETNTTRVIETKPVQKVKPLKEEKQDVVKPQVPNLPNKPMRVPPKPIQNVNAVPSRPAQNVNKVPPRPPQRPNGDIK